MFLVVGKLFIKAPSGFILNNKFCLNVKVDDRERPVMSTSLYSSLELTQMTKWVQFPNGKDHQNPSYICQSEMNPSNIGTVRPSLNNYFKGGVLYVFTLMVDNPLSVAEAEPWEFVSR